VLKMKVQVVGLDQISMLPVVILTDVMEEKFLPLVIGPAEANAISLALEEVEPPRPMTHDLMLSVVATLGGSVDKVVITDLVEETYYAQVFVKTEEKEHQIDARPSDSIALALRCDAPIFVEQKVAEKAMVAKRQDDPEMEDFKRFLENLTPDDFRKNN